MYLAESKVETYIHVNNQCNIFDVRLSFNLLKVITVPAEVYTGKLFMVDNDIPEVANTFEGSRCFYRVLPYISS